VGLFIFLKLDMSLLEFIGLETMELPSKSGVRFQFCRPQVLSGVRLEGVFGGHRRRKNRASLLGRLQQRLRTLDPAARIERQHLLQVAVQNSAGRHREGIRVDL
jgi:hypothetical protein